MRNVTLGNNLKPGMLKLTTSRSQSNLRTVFIFNACEENGYYRVVSVGHLDFNCRSYCGRSRRMQGFAHLTDVKIANFACKI